MWTFLTIAVICSVMSSAMWGGRHRPRRLDRESEGRLQDLAARLAERDDEMDSLHVRIAELENRLDFAERLLVERTTPDTIGAPASRAIHS